ncbi:TPA: hypothetical protein JI046_12910 [Acinetobacter baumannii]|nr:hypothetical protein [Acinetobacter baumannii]
MNKSNDQTKQHHTEGTMVRWTEKQMAAIEAAAFSQKKRPAVFIREFMLENCPAFKPTEKDERL